MTVQEAKEILEYYYNQEWFLEKDQPAKNSLQIAIESMKELEQYRALGTPKEIKIREVSSAQLGKAYLSNLTELREYQSLGTVEELKEAREKQIHKIKFDNACGCIFDEEVLFNAIDLECRNRNCYRQDEYRIYLHNDYPCISLGHDKVRIHILIGKLIYGNIRKGYVMHHKDHNKRNALPSNLEYISNSAHTKLHHKGEDFRSEEGKKKSINSAREKIYKKEITKAEIESMLLQGKTKTEIAKHFQCGVNTIYRRLGYKC